MPLLNRYRADLHIHTVLSPCADLDMGPVNIIRAAHRLGTGIIAIADHHAAANVPAVMEYAGAGPPLIIPGIEVQTREDVHLLCLFSGLRAADDFAALIREKLPPVRNRPELFGEQVVVNGAEEILYFEEILLAGSVDMTVEGVAREVIARDGLLIPSHVDRPAYSLLANLGFLPPGLAVDALEIARPELMGKLWAEHPGLKGMPFITSSDAHFLSQMDTEYVTVFDLAEPSFWEIKLALGGKAGRRVAIEAREPDHAEP
ncbi:MAG TPA: histidinol-phosphatase [Firmicutes bacterium]|nr:histidinol-phosphatase [Bacillota bacterium]